MQAARGASLTSDSEAGPGDADTSARPSRRRRTALLLGIAVVAIALDQVTKQLASHGLADGRPVDVLGHLLRLRLAHNSGAAFSTGTRYTLLISLAAIVAAVVVLFISRRVRSGWWAVTLGILLGGIGGNLADRIVRDPEPLRGHVVDFLELPNWPIFNVADICINIGAALILILAMRGLRLDGTRQTDEHR